VLVVAILVVALVVLRVMTSDERQRIVGRVRGVLTQIRDARSQIRPCEPLRTNLLERTPRLLAVPGLAALMVLASLLGSSEGLANVGPLTTSGEWWRLLTAPFVQRSLLALLLVLAAFTQPALLLERLVGPGAFTTVFFAGALVAGAAQLASDPVDVNLGAAPAIFAIYGLLLVAVGHGVIWRSPFTILPLAIKRLVPAIVVFLLFHGLTAGFERADAAGFVAGAVSGAVLTMRIGERKPTLRQVAGVAASAAVATLGVALTIDHIVDARPEMANVVALEQRLANAYDAAVARFSRGAVQTDALVKLIEQTIVPELQAAEQRVTTLGTVPAEQQLLVTDAEEYLRLRQESWQLRLEGLKTTNLQRLRQADKTERASLGALERIRPKVTARPISDPE
jgi:membrane associated rhomboid family serine protease